MRTSNVRAPFQALRSPIAQCVLFAAAAGCLARFFLTDSGTFAVLGTIFFASLVAIRVREEKSALHCACRSFVDIDEGPAINPSTGLPMLFGTSVDVSGKAYGQPRER